ILVARRRTKLLGGMVGMPVPGAAALVWPPQVLPGGEREAVEDGLIEHLRVWLRRSGGRLGQALLLPEEAHLASPLERNGYRHVTRLAYLRHNLNGPWNTFWPEQRLDYEAYHLLSDPGLFHETLLRTYDGTLDCPELNGVRTLDEVLE